MLINQSSVRAQIKTEGQQKNTVLGTEKIKTGDGREKSKLLNVDPSRRMN